MNEARDTREDHRLFFALWPDDDVRARLAEAVAGVSAFDGAGRHVDVAKYHLTLHFLGGWPTAPDDTIARARGAASHVESTAFHLVVDHAGSFRGAKVGWLAPAGNSGLDALWSELGHALDDAQLSPRAHERFSPHVTVLRGVRDAIAEAPVEPISWPVSDFVLVHSHGGRYDVVDRWALA